MESKIPDTKVYESIAPSIPLEHNTALSERNGDKVDKKELLLVMELKARSILQSSYVSNCHT